MDLSLSTPTGPGPVSPRTFELFSRRARERPKSATFTLFLLSQSTFPDWVSDWQVYEGRMEGSSERKQSHRGSERGHMTSKCKLSFRSL